MEHTDILHHHNEAFPETPRTPGTPYSPGVVDQPKKADDITVDHNRHNHDPPVQELASASLHDKAKGV
jgi:hypothetical protein